MTNHADMHSDWQAAGRRARRRRTFLLLLALGTLLRMGWVLIRYARGGAEVLQFPDEEAYLQVARSLAGGTGLVDEFGYRATYMPAYPAFIAVFLCLARPLLWVRLAQCLLAALVAPATWMLARSFLNYSSDHDGRRRGDGAAVLAGVAAACDPFLIFFSGLLLTEALTATILAIAWALVVSLCGAGRGPRVRDAVGSGVLLWAAVMLRPSSFILVPVAGAVAVIAGRFSRRSIMCAVVLTGIVLVGLLPWAERNRQLLGKRVWLTTRGGISLYDGVQPGATGGSDLAHTKTMPQVRHLDEIEWNAYFSSRAWAEIRQDPGRIVHLAWMKFRRTWSLAPNADGYRQGIAATVGVVWMGALLVLAAVGLWRVRRRTETIVLLLPVMAVTVMHMIYIGSVRYRVPVMPMVEVISALAMWSILRRPRTGRAESLNGAES